jgi:hypothetical protein
MLGRSAPAVDVRVGRVSSAGVARSDDGGSAPLAVREDPEKVCFLPSAA